MCKQYRDAPPFSVNGIPFGVSECAAHQHAFGSVLMPSGGVVTIFAQAVDRPALVGQAATVLADVMILAEAEVAMPGAHPFDLLGLIGGKQVKR